MSKFKNLSEFSAGPAAGFSLMPFNFIRLPNGDYRLVTLSGSCIDVEQSDLESLVTKSLENDSDLYYDLRSKGFLFDSNTKSNIQFEACSY